MPPRPAGRLAALLILSLLPLAAGCGRAGEPPGDPSGKVPGTASDAADESSGKVPGTSVEVRYLANEGVLLSVLEPEGEIGSRVLIDGLFRTEVPGYPVLPESHREFLETASPPYAGIDLILATHLHGDHFSPEAVARYLAAEPKARLLSTPQAVERLLAQPGAEAYRSRVEAVLPQPGERVERRYEVPGTREGARDLPGGSGDVPGGIGVAVYELDHGPGTNAQNLGFSVELAGRRFLHVGDTEVAPETIAALGFEHPRIHAAFLPYWLLLRRSGEAWLEAVSADLTVAVHWPAPDAPRSYFEPGSSLSEIRGAIRERYPEVILPPVEPSAPGDEEGVLFRLPAVEPSADPGTKASGSAP